MIYIHGRTATNNLAKCFDTPPFGQCPNLHGSSWGEVFNKQKKCNSLSFLTTRGWGDGTTKDQKDKLLPRKECIFFFRNHKESF